MIKVGVLSDIIYHGILNIKRAFWSGTHTHTKVSISRRCKERLGCSAWKIFRNRQDEFILPD